MNRIFSMMVLILFLAILLFSPVSGFPADVVMADVVMVDAQKQYQLAQTLFEEKEFSAAAHEYIRFFHLFPHHERVVEARYNTGVSFFNAGRFDDAVRHLAAVAELGTDLKFVPDRLKSGRTKFDGTKFDGTQSGLAVDAMFKLSEVYVAMDKPGMAVSVLRNLVTLTRAGDLEINLKSGADFISPLPLETDLKPVPGGTQSVSEIGSIGDRACFVLGWLLLDKADVLKSRSDYPVYPVREAEKYFSMISLEGKKKYRMENSIASLEKIGQLKKKIPAVAGALSVVPGGGFLYCERYQDALVSFLLNSSLMLAAYESFENDNKFLGGAICFVEAGFYTGNIYGSITSAHKYNQTKQKQFIDSLKQDYRDHKNKVSFHPGFVKNGMAFMLKYKF
ncbi:tetratricopeptide repeat protein [Desulfobacula toluolica]|uniref:Uncharacterized protein n=1 Tax=Desulfobacula toluolica (strain DSM 7467 / Tol2) TaxID=651182 RepID=K0NFA1_DESTT|nr:tetratricopeptide repeat protein [Desulfobacula toluolica]CCK79555.1 uncharacterized protein TOL2_C13920 [Desulfobacula toluolica Tol2]